VEPLALGRYREFIEGFAYANSLEGTRKALLKPRNPRGHVPRSIEYLPMLLTLALAWDGLETHIGDAEESDVTSFTSGDFEDSRESSNDDSQHSSSSDDSEGPGNDASHRGDASEDGSMEHSIESEEESEKD
jgi:hypothetical protein